MSMVLVLFVALAGGVVRPPAAGAAAILIPDHTFRLGSCGGPQGPACTWNCGVGRSCSADGACSLHGTQAFGAVVSVKVDAAPCGGGDGSILTLGLAAAGANPFQAAETAFDLCGRNVSCTGRSTRSCGTCAEANDCFSDGGDGEYPCPPGPVVFMCSDPCGGAAPFLGEDNFFDLLGWVRESVQPLPDLLRSQVPDAPAVGRPVIYHADFPFVSSDAPPQANVCVRVAYTSQDRPLGVCSTDATRLCATDADCKKGTCESGTPAGVNPPQPDPNAGTAICAGPGTDAGHPCGADADCESGSCTALPATPTSFCDVSGTSCDSSPCPGGETCITCPQPACGDGVLDPGEDCDVGPFGPGNGCDATCHVEPCFACEGPLGETSSCFQQVSGEPCDLDGRPCTADSCNGFGQCVAGVAPVACAGALATKAKVEIKRDAAVPAKGKLKWKWAGAAAFDVGNLGFPSTTDDVSVCAYDQTGVVFEATAPAGGTCAGKPCWTLTETKAGYKDKEATPDGLTKIQAKSGDAGKGKLQAQGKGADLDVPPLPLTPPARVLLMRGFGPQCWDATFPTSIKNDGKVFKAKN